MNVMGQLLLLFLISGCLNAVPQENPRGVSDKIYHDPEIDKKQRQGLIHNRKYLNDKLAPYNLDVDSLQDVVDNLNRETQALEWEYQISTAKQSPGQIRKVYKSHRNAGGSSGRTMYGEEYRRRPDTQ